MNFSFGKSPVVGKCFFMGAVERRQVCLILAWGQYLCLIPLAERMLFARLGDRPN